MRLDELPRSDNIEDRRGESSSAGGFSIPGGRGGLGIGTIVVLGLVGWVFGIDPRVLIGGAEMISGGGSSYQQQDRTAPNPSSRTGAPSDQMGQLVSGVLGSTEVQWTQIFAQSGRNYAASDARHVLGRYQFGLRVCESSNGAVLLSE